MVVISLVITTASFLLMILFPQFAWLVTAAGVGLLLWNSARFWKVLPPFATERVIAMGAKIPGFNKLIGRRIIL